MLISKFVNFLTHDLTTNTNCELKKKKVNTGYTFYFIEFEAKFFRMHFLLAATWQCFKILKWHLIQISQLMLNLTKLGN